MSNAAPSSHLGKTSSMGAPVLHLPARLDAHAAGELSKIWEKSIPQGRGLLIINTDACGEFDSSALALLLASRRWASAAQRPIQITHSSARLRQLAEVYGVAELLFDSKNI